MNRVCIAIAAVAILGAVVPGPVLADDVGQKATAVVQKQAPSIVTIRIVYDMEFGGQTREHRGNTHGVMVSDTGLILTAMETVKPNVNARDPRGRSLAVKIKPADIKIVFEKEEKEWDAFVVVKDTKRGLAFLQLKDFKPADRKIQFVDFARSGTAAVGDEVVSVHRLSKGYDYVAFFTTSRIIGELKKPRKALMIHRGSLSGMPVFTLEGKLIGCHARMKPSIEEGQRSRATGTPVVLSAREVNGVIKQALKKAAEGKEAAEDEPDEKTPEEEKP
jgi:S1-C subfamily serine protease